MYSVSRLHTLVQLVPVEEAVTRLPEKKGLFSFGDFGHLQFHTSSVHSSRWMHSTSSILLCHSHSYSAAVGDYLRYSIGPAGKACVKGHSYTLGLSIQYFCERKVKGAGLIYL